MEPFYSCKTHSNIKGERAEHGYAEPGPGKSLQLSIPPVPVQDAEEDAHPPPTFITWIGMLNRCEQQGADQWVPERINCSRVRGPAGLSALPDPLNLHNGVHSLADQVGLQNQWSPDT